ncbi:hypothetical protein LX15_003286 [Streptoalloteichus tenebrarius]|uniref:Carbohydrate-binding protein n=1 Tax=Streptoalloteichus tenebrarius (strain ATCC 17920 / DSM 40477 / JCM 4838 / CBS 697.72 / NBRC 16177 / NCIMB 11028 / NRRL B-12390 / A12253. 1 / ISP 5477) TaxID=1933 RepID=A0ABT1HVQ9_STRSD|nr:carbohydrate-binding protein [Streptoalloteichus tenebrarius]MCP2259581.1 hypothetical protein [Streptoalloteichus tenebrarius]BFF01012.1 hypothetical protein GCM10020241_26870 [Streptoalloteichus tenebrarius]
MRRTTRRVAVLAAAVVLSGLAAGLTAVGEPAAGPPDPHAPVGGEVPGVEGAPAERAAGTAAARFRESRRSGGPRGEAAGAAQIHHFWGVMPPDTGAGDGMMATHSVHPDLRIPNNEDFVYAPTSKPGNDSCVEVVTSYSKYYGPQIWAWDWCRTGNLAKQVPVDDRFLDTYTTTVNGHRAYTVQNIRTNAANNTWTAYLYNHATRKWDVLFTSSGRDRSDTTYGWDVFEIYSAVDPSTGRGYYCAASVGKPFESNDIKLRKGGSWVAASPVESPFVPEKPDPADYQCPSLRFHVRHANDHWVVQH